MESFPIRPPAPEPPVLESPVLVTPRRKPLLPRRPKAHLWVLGGLTFVGFILRFSVLDRPALWAGEANVWAASSGTYRQVVASGSRHLLSPLHLQLYWLIARFVQLGPKVMRFFPALAGTLLIPAIYFLARQIASRRTALVAATIATCSAFTLATSRDARPLAELTLMVTVSVACLLWWVRAPRGRTRVAWLAWVGASVAMVGLHPFATVVLLIQPLIAVAGGGRSLGRWRAAALAGGFFIALLAANGTLRAARSWQPVVATDVGSTPFQRVARAGGEIFLGIPWPTGSERNEIPTGTMRLIKLSAFLVFLPLAFGVLPWAKWRENDERSNGHRSVLAKARSIAAALLAAIVLALILPRRAELSTAISAIVWPAACVGMALMVMCLPNSPLRGVAVLLICVGNLACESSAVILQVEPPVDEIAIDLAATRDLADTSRTYVSAGLQGTDGHGGGSIFNEVGEYYRALLNDRSPIRVMQDADALLADLHTAPQVDRLIVWDRFDHTRGDTTEPLETRLGAGWQLLSQGQRAVRGQSWQYRYTIRRREYVKNLSTPE